MEDKILELGDDINTDDIIPAKRCTLPLEQLKDYAFEHLLDGGKLSDYDKIVAGRNFGSGSSREHAPVAIKGAGIKEVAAKSFSEIFFRNSVNIGLNINLRNGPEFPDLIKKIIETGGLIEFSKKILSGEMQLEVVKNEPRNMTIAEKLLARASGNDNLKPGDVVFAKVDLAMSHDAVCHHAARIFETNFDSKVFDPEKIVLVADHFIQVPLIRDDPDAFNGYRQMKDFASRQGCIFYDVAGENEAEGICHSLLPEKGHVKPGMIIVGTDSHTCTYGAHGCFSTGIGTTDLACAFATGKYWVEVPQTVKVVVDGDVSYGVMAKDIMLRILKELGSSAQRKVIEFSGSVVEKMCMDEKATLSNMAIEAGALCGVIETEDVKADEGAEYADVIELDVTGLKAQVAEPYLPSNSVDCEDVADVKVDKCYVGSCTGGKLEDLKMAAAVLEGKKVAEGVKLFVVPATQDIKKKAAELGYMKILEDAGAKVLPTGCGACINSGPGNLKENEVGLYATNRNFKGRNGHPSSKVYLASPRTVASSAVEGKIRC